MKKSAELKPTAILREVRRSVSEILGRPFTERIDHQEFKPDQKILALWAADCATRVLPYFEEKHPHDNRPRKAIEVLHEWIRTGKFSMKAIREASLSAHAAAKTTKEELDAIYAAHAAGQAVGTAHVVTHSFGSSVYAIRAATSHSGRMEDALKERDWQLKRLKKYAKNSKRINPK